MFRTSAASTYTALFLILTASVCEAQAPASGGISFTADAALAHQNDAGLKDGGGDFNVDRWFLSAGVNYSWGGRNSVGFSLGGGRSVYEFDADSGFGMGDPWDTVNDFRLAAPMRFRVSEKATAIIIPSLRFNGESGADSGDSSTYGLFAAVAWRIRQGLTIGPGIGVFSRLDEGSQIFPVIAIDWDISERWNLGTGSGLAASQGPGLTLTYKASEHWKVGLSGRYENLEFRLDDAGPAPAGIGRDQSFPLVISAIVAPNRKVSLALFTGLEFGGKLKLKNSSGEVVAESSYDPAFIIGVTGVARF